MLSLRNFYVTITFWSSQDNLNNKKARKTKENQRLKSCHDFSGRMQYFEDKENVSRLQKRDTI